MHRAPLELRPLTGPGLQFSLLLLVFTLFLAGPLPGPRHFGSGQPVLSPRMRGPEHRVEAPDDLVVTVQADGCVFIGHKWYPAPELLPAIKAHLAGTSHPRVLARLDRSLAFGSARSLFRVLQAAKVSSVLLVTYEDYADAPDFPLPLLFKNAT